MLHVRMTLPIRPEGGFKRMAASDPLRTCSSSSQCAKLAFGRVRDKACAASCDIAAVLVYRDRLCYPPNRTAASRQHLLAGRFCV